MLAPSVAELRDDSRAKIELALWNRRCELEQHFAQSTHTEAGYHVYTAWLVWCRRAGVGLVDTLFEAAPSVAGPGDMHLGADMVSVEARLTGDGYGCEAAAFVHHSTHSYTLAGIAA